MSYGKKNINRNKDEDEILEPIFGSRAEYQDIPKYRLSNESIEPQIDYRIVKDELLNKGNARQNLATFCQTYMENEAIILMSETLEKNAIDRIDKSEYPRTAYPRTAELKNRCVNMIADLWHADKKEKFIGTSMLGSSEACILGALSIKFAWRTRAEKLGLNIHLWISLSRCRMDTLAR